jgi:hypothetical protein
MAGKEPKAGEACSQVRRDAERPAQEQVGGDRFRRGETGLRRGRRRRWAGGIQGRGGSGSRWS